MMKINICNYHVLRRTFVRQLTTGDCGQACIAMLLRYAGDVQSARIMLNTEMAGNQSLLALRKTINLYGYQADCVSMTPEYLAGVDKPCILHTEDGQGNMHYQVYFGILRSWRGRRLIMADPANHFYTIKMKELDYIWRSKTALYVTDLTADLSYFKRSDKYRFVIAADIPAVIWILIPLLTIINALFGVSLSFLLQRGLMYNNILNSSRLIISFAILLLIISVFKSAFSYLKQMILIKINLVLRASFFSKLTERISALKNFDDTQIHRSDWTKRCFQEITVVQHALSVFIATIVSEGSFLIILLSAISYVSPLAGLILGCFLFLETVSALYTSSETLYKNSIIKQKAFAIEKLLTNISYTGDTSPIDITQAEADHIDMSRRQAVSLNKKSTLHELLGALVVIITLTIVSVAYSRSELTYPSLMFVVFSAYVAVSMTPKIYASYLSFAEGVDTYTQLLLRLSNS